jgi:two-component system response regulator HydG
LTLRIPRLLIIVGPVAVLYVLAARASSDASEAAGWLTSACALGCTLFPLAFAGVKTDRRVAAVALMASLIGVALASAQTSDLWLDRVHDGAWLGISALVLGLALPTSIRRGLRAAFVFAFVASAIMAASAAGAGLVPPQAFGVVVVSGLLASAALHQVLLTSRGHAVEGAISAIALVTLSVGLAYAWFGPLEGALARFIETGVGVLLWLAHLAWVDARWRGLRRTGVPFLVASVAVFLLALAWAPDRDLAPWERGVAFVVAAVSWWVTFQLAKRISRRTVWSTSEQLAAASAAARRALYGAPSLEAAATAALGPLQPVFQGVPEPPEIIAFEPPLRVRLAPGGRVELRTGEAPEPVVRAFGLASRPAIVDLLVLRERVVREPGVRELAAHMESRRIGAIVPCVRDDHLEGILVLPASDRDDALSSVERDALLRLGNALGTTLASTLAERRAQSHIHQVSELRRSAEARVAELETEVEQLRGQCDVLGRGSAEDQSLHVAYSPSMRRVQTRAIELAGGAEPCLIRGASGAPMLQVARFIHDRGPLWEAPFVVVDCAAVAPEEATIRLFGDGSGRPGWMTSARTGTLLLRDLPALPTEAQSRLADALREPSSSEPRVLATVRTVHDERDLFHAIDADLAEAFRVNTLWVPSLRERREDVPSLVLLAVDRACRILSRDPVGIDQAAMAALVDHDWPGDVAELDLVVQLAVARVRGRTIGLSDLPPLAWSQSPLEEALDGTYVEVERRLLEQALRAAGGNKSEAARRLGLKRTTFLDKLRRHGLERRLESDVEGSAVG